MILLVSIFRSVVWCSKGFHLKFVRRVSYRCDVLRGFPTKCLTSVFPTGVTFALWRAGPVPTDRAWHGAATAERVLQLPRRGQGHQRARQVQGLRSEEGGRQSADDDPYSGRSVV